MGIVRSLMYLFLAHLRRPDRPPTDDFTPDLTVIVPAFNEEISIVACVRGVLASDYPDLSVIVMDDGSTDHTFDLVRDTFRDDPRVRVLHQANKGKWMALDRAYGHVHTEFVVSVDADTLVRPDAIRHLVQKLRDPAVGAVAGVVKVANRVNFLTRFQALEYITTQNIIRRAADVYNGQLVVPGAIGAWRVEAVRKAGLYSGDTLAEDADLTISVQRAGYRVAFEERAIAETEAPASLRPFMRQRLRWVLGMLQTGWKHRGTIREGRSVGLISITDFPGRGVVEPASGTGRGSGDAAGAGGRRSEPGAGAADPAGGDECRLHRGLSGAAGAGSADRRRRLSVRSRGVALAAWPWFRCNASTTDSFCISPFTVRSGGRRRAALPVGARPCAARQARDRDQARTPIGQVTPVPPIPQ